MIKEIFLLRSVSCIAVVLAHAISVTFIDFDIREDPNYLLVNSAMFAFQILLLFGTPLFVFISEFVLANRYKSAAPKGFWIKRIKYIFIPYAVIGTAYSIYNSYTVGLNSISEYLLAIFNMIAIGGYHGYFVLIIFQFYVLHFIFNRYVVDNFKARSVIAFSIIVNVAYLFVFNFMLPEDASWYSLLIRPFPGWIAYFVIAYYGGRNLTSFKELIVKYRKVVITGPFITGFIVILLCYTEILTPIQSKRVDMIFYTLSVALFLFYIGMQIKRIPIVMIKISQYSFGIYLLHPVIQKVTSRFTFTEFSVPNLILNIIIYLLLGILLPVIIVHLLNKLRFGYMIVGKIGIQLKSRTYLDTSKP